MDQEGLIYEYIPEEIINEQGDGYEVYVSDSSSEVSNDSNDSFRRSLATKKKQHEQRKKTFADFLDKEEEIEQPLFTEDRIRDIEEKLNSNENDKIHSKNLFNSLITSVLASIMAFSFMDTLWYNPMGMFCAFIGYVLVALSVYMYDLHVQRIEIPQEE